MPYDNFDRFIPHKKDIKMQAKINSSTHYDTEKAALLDGLNSELEAQTVNDLSLKDIFKDIQQDKDEFVNDDEKKYTDLFIPVNFDGETVEKHFVAGSEIKIIEKNNEIYLKSNNDNLEKTYILWNVNGALEGFGSVKDYYVLISTLMGVDTLEDAMFILEKLVKANYNGCSPFYRDTTQSKLTDTEKMQRVQEFLLSRVVGYKYLLRIPLGFSRLERVRKIKIIDECTIYSINLEENNIDEVSFIARDDSITKIGEAYSYVGLVNRKDYKKYLVDESLDDQANGLEEIEESVYPAIADSLVL